MSIEHNKTKTWVQCDVCGTAADKEKTTPAPGYENIGHDWAVENAIFTHRFGFINTPTGRSLDVCPTHGGVCPNCEEQHTVRQTFSAVTWDGLTATTTCANCGHNQAITFRDDLGIQGD